MYDVDTRCCFTDMPAQPLVTVVVPTRNGGAGFQDNLRAMLDQRLDGSFEVLVIDSGSTDGTRETSRARSDPPG